MKDHVVLFVASLALLVLVRGAMHQHGKDAHPAVTMTTASSTEEEISVGPDPDPIPRGDPRWDTFQDSFLDKNAWTVFDSRLTWVYQQFVTLVKPKADTYPILQYAGVIRGLNNSVYFSPYITGPGHHGSVLYYDTTSAFNEWPSWKHYQAEKTDGMDIRGYIGGTTHGKYIYFSPMKSDANEFHARVLRHDMTRPLEDQTSWEAYDAEGTDGLPHVKGYAGAVSVGPYVFFVPTAYEKTRLGYHGTVLRYDTRKDFKDTAAWSAYDASRTDGRRCVGYHTAVVHENYIYFVPYSGTPEFEHGVMLRYDTTLNFKNPRAWESYDAGLTGGKKTVGFLSATIVGNWLYFAPCSSEGIPYAIALRYNLNRVFQDPVSWEAYDFSNNWVHEYGPVSGYSGIVSYGPYLYYSPGTTGRFIRHDTRLGFKEPKAWAIHMIRQVDNKDVSESYGALRVGSHIYFAPAGGHAVLRFTPEGPDHLNDGILMDEDEPASELHDEL